MTSTTSGFGPDVIHGQHFITAMAALAYFDDVPVVNVSHGWRPWSEAPLMHPNVVRYVAVDEATRDRIALQYGVADDRIATVHNFVDLERFRPTAQPNERLERILLFSNYVNEHSPYLRAARQAADELGAQLDVIGSNADTATDKPEAVLGDYDVVLAQGRSALEAMAVGASVMICSSRAFGPLIRSDNVERLRNLNFGIRTQTLPVSAASITSQLSAYSATDAAEVSSWIRQRVGLTPAVTRLVEIYTEAVEQFDPAQVDRREAAKASGRFFAEITGEFHDVRNDRDAVRRRARADAQGKKLQARAQGERNDLRAQLTRARSELADERRTVKQLRQRVDAQQTRLDQLLGSRAVRAQRRLRSAPALTKTYRSVLGALGRR